MIANSRMRDSCRQLFKSLKILPLASQYIFSLAMFVVKNRELFNLNSDIHYFATRYNNDFHLPSAQLTLFQRGVYYSGIKIFNHLPLSIKNLARDIRQFKRALKGFIQLNSSYSLEEYYNFN